MCRPCGEVVALPRGEKVGEPEAKLYRPEGVRLAEDLDGEEYVATIGPNTMSALPGVVFCLVWDGFLVLWYWIAIRSGAWFMGLFAVLHLGAGIYVTHQTLVGLFNVRTLRVGAGRVTFRSAPIPFAGKLDASVDDLDGFAVVEVPTRRSINHQVVANFKNGASRKLDVVTTEFDGTRYIAASFNDALRRARDRTQGRALPAYRG